MIINSNVFIDFNYFVIFSIVFYYVLFSVQSVKRFHDIGLWGGFGYVWLFIPFANLYFFYQLYFVKGRGVDTDGTCYVYLMVDLSNNCHKIGMSNKPKYREKTLQSEKPTIELLKSKKFKTRKEAAGIEKQLHKEYRSKRLRGEWFKLNKSELKNVNDFLS